MSEKGENTNKVEFVNAKNEEKTFLYNSTFFHSSYSPSKEAERFFSTISFPYNPKNIIVIEPGLPYLYPLLKEKYNQAKIGIVRIIPQLNDYKNNANPWDFVLNGTEEDLLLTQIVIPPITQKLFNDKVNLIFTLFKDSLNKAKTILITRQFFEKKWLKNAVTFVKYCKNVAILNQQNNFPIVITASGPSLLSALPFLKKYNNRFFLIALSSSVSVLLQNQIPIDLVLTTDGGFWAGMHLRKVCKNQNIPVAAPIEAFIPKIILENNLIIPINYEDGVTSNFFNLCSMEYLSGERNGTVSGTALKLAQKITTNKIYFCGLDLLGQKGYQHSQPNEIDIFNSPFENKIFPLALRQTSSEFNTSSLNIYREWFCNLSNVENVFRIIDDQNNKQLGNITDIKSEQFGRKLEKEIIINKNGLFKNAKKFSLEEKNHNLENIWQYIEKNIFSEYWTNQLFPIDIVSIKHNKNNNELSNNLQNKILELKNQLWNILYDRK